MCSYPEVYAPNVCGLQSLCQYSLTAPWGAPTPLNQCKAHTNRDTISLAGMSQDPHLGFVWPIIQLLHHHLISNVARPGIGCLRPCPSSHSAMAGRKYW